MKTFKNIEEFRKEFSTDEKCRKYLEQQRWNGTPACPFCGSINVHHFPNGKIFKCREKQCRQKFSVLVGTVYQNTKIPLTKWFLATYILSLQFFKNFSLFWIWYIFGYLYRLSYEMELSHKANYQDTQIYKFCII